MARKMRSSIADIIGGHIRLLTVPVLLLLFVSGCGAKQNPRIAALRSQFLTATSLEGEMSVSSIREQLKAPEAPGSVPVVIRGQITAGDLPPWEPGKAAFVLTDTTGHDGDEEHDPHTCPFCSRNIQDYLVNVYFRDDQGDVIEIDSRELFDLQEKQTVIIQGSGSIGADGTLQVDATKIFLRR